jgi:hypothetical protein
MDYPQSAADALRIVISNDDGEYLEALTLAERFVKSEGSPKAAKQPLADYLQDFFRGEAWEMRDAGHGNYLLLHALLPHAVDWVDWDELAGDLINGYLAEAG